MAGYTKENDFIIAEGSAGELYIFINAKVGTPSSPAIIYDGQDHAIFVRSPEEKIILDYINPEIRKELRNALEVIVVETILENIKDSYHVKMNYVDSIPLDWSQIGLSTWEDAYLNA